LRENTDELIGFIDVVVASERLCAQLGHKTPESMLDYLRKKGCAVGAVTLGERGVVWFDQGSENKSLPAFHVPAERVIDTNGAGDTFHGGYVYSLVNNPSAKWEDHFRFAAAASAHAVQYLGIEAGLPVLANVESILHGRPRLAAANE
jgi:sugar/nucleoside kinase (ribokinase family)